MSTQITKFPLRNFKGAPIRFIRCETETASTGQPVEGKKPSHHILVVDRSGSMYGTIDEVKSTIEKLLTLTEFRDPSLRISLITYSSKGDVKLHFKGVTVADVMATNSPQLREVRSIRATSMTCISQGLALAETIVDDADITAVTLHTDGYANDYSPMAESRDIKTAVASLKKHPGVFVNTIGYGGWCDFNLLASIANALSGTCIQATGIAQVYAAVYNTTKLVAGAVSPAVEFPVGKANYVAFLSKSGRKVLGSTASLTVQGLAAVDDKTAFRFYEIPEREYDALSVPVNGEDAPVEPVLAYTRAQIAEGNLNAAKFAMVQTRCTDLIGGHAKALVASDIAAFAAATETYLFDRATFTPSATYGLGVTGPSVLEVLTYLNSHTANLSVNLPALASGYRRRGIKRIPGTRLADGSVEEPTVTSKNREGDGWVKVNGFELNRNTATANMLLSQPMDLFPKGSTTRIASVAGVSLDNLRSFNNYTIVGDGSLNVASLTLRTADQKVIDGLRALGLTLVRPDSREEAKAGEPFNIILQGLPLVDYDLNVGGVSLTAVQNLTRLTVLSKVLNGMVKGDPSGFTPEQVADLKAHYLTPALNFSPPTTTSYAKLEDAIANGEVDTKLSYKINVGTAEITGMDKLRSGNEYLQRRFTANFNGTDVEKPTLDLLTVPNVVWGVKKLSARTTLDAVDTISYPIYEGLLGLGEGKEVKELLTLVGCQDPDLWIASLRGENAKASVKDAIEFVDLAIERAYNVIRPLAFYVGATGIVPDTLGATALNAEDFAKKYPEAKLSKAEKEEGSFFILPDGTVLTVYVKAELFSTGV
jgi:Mg-chelatase subunit ChlD